MAEKGQIPDSSRIVLDVQERILNSSIIVLAVQGQILDSSKIVFSDLDVHAQSSDSPNFFLADPGQISDSSRNFLADPGVIVDSPSVEPDVHRQIPDYSIMVLADPGPGQISDSTNVVPAIHGQFYSCQISFGSTLKISTVQMLSVYSKVNTITVLDLSEVSKDNSKPVRNLSMDIMVTTLEV